MVPRAFVDQKRLRDAIAEVEQALKPDVVRIRYSVGDDWSGDPALYLRVLLTDAASRPRRLHGVANRVEALIAERIDPYNSWGLIPYFKFRSESEQADLKEPAWA